MYLNVQWTQKRNSYPLFPIIPSKKRRKNHSYLRKNNRALIAVRYHPLNATHPHKNHPNLLPALNFNDQSLKLPDECGPITLDHAKLRDLLENTSQGWILWQSDKTILPSFYATPKNMATRNKHMLRTCQHVTNEMSCTKLQVQEREESLPLPLSLFLSSITHAH